MKPKQPGNGWIEFSQGSNSSLVVNVRRMKLEPKSNADTFAKFNPYVNTWERKTVLGAAAFGTNTDTGNKIIHRLIIVKNGYAWMLNCVDANGKTSDAGQTIFDSMVSTFRLAPTAAEKRAVAAHRSRMNRATRNMEAAAKAMRQYASNTNAKPAAKAVAKPAVKTAPKAIAKPVKAAPKTVTTPVTKTTVKPTAVPTTPEKRTP